ncbi:DMT family transporter [Kineosporia sp. A_224]|uniref:DMT family transporter n=1 Tax=Kineosporia sp. A_224 TaxID=1962180 RepID=UPI00117B365B|nr:DMT family transporter [Kineosporia sp. A_224]
MRDRRGMLMLSAAGVLWGTLGPAVRALQDDGLATLSITFWRLVLATTVLFLLVGRPGLRALRTEASRPWRLVLVGVLFAVFQTTFFVGVKEAGVAVGTLVTLGIAPVAAAVVESVRERALPAARTVVTIGSAVLGLGLVCAASGADAAAAPRPLLGIAASLVSGLSYAASTMVSGPLTRRLGAVVITAASTAVALLVVTPFALAGGVAIPVGPRTLVGIAWLGVVTTVFTYVLFYAGLRTVRGSVAMILTLLEPATAVVIAVVAFGEPVTVAGTIGTLLLIGAVALLYLTPQGARIEAGTPPPG